MSTLNENILIRRKQRNRSAILMQQFQNKIAPNISRTTPDVTHPNLIHYPLDVPAKDVLPEIE
jgi:hypothetical protein